MILAGPLEKKYKDETGLEVKVDNLFREENTCWDDVPYFKVHKYHVTSAADIHFNPLQGTRATGNAKRDAENRLRDSDVTLRKKQFLKLLKTAVRGVLVRRE